MLKRLFGLAVVLVWLVVMVSSVSVVGATPSQPVSGTWQLANILSASAQSVDGNCIIELVDTSNFQGHLVGTATTHTRIVHRGPCDQPAAEVFESQGTFQGTVGNVLGAFNYQLQGNADAEGYVQGQLVVLTATGGLANLRGQLTLTGHLPSLLDGTYSGDIHLEP